jgi:hypothetical protein
MIEVLTRAIFWLFVILTVGSAAVGAIPRDADTVRVFVRLDFEKRSVYNVYLWGPRRILGLRGTPELPPLRYLPTSEREFAAFSLDGGGVERRLRFIEEISDPALLPLGSDRYDLIFSEPSNPFRAGISSLFTTEFYALIRDRLTDDGVMTMQAGMTEALWRWLVKEGWREITFRPDRRRYRDPQDLRVSPAAHVEFPLSC